MFSGINLVWTKNGHFSKSRNSLGCPQKEWVTRIDHFLNSNCSPICPVYTNFWNLAKCVKGKKVMMILVKRFFSRQDVLPILYNFFFLTANLGLGFNTLVYTVLFTYLEWIQPIFFDLAGSGSPSHLPRMDLNHRKRINIEEKAMIIAAV